MLLPGRLALCWMWVSIWRSLYGIVSTKLLKTLLQPEVENVWIEEGGRRGVRWRSLS